MMDFDVNNNNNLHNTKAKPKEKNHWACLILPKSREAKSKLHSSHRLFLLQFNERVSVRKSAELEEREQLPKKETSSNET